VKIIICKAMDWDAIFEDHGGKKPSKIIEASAATSLQLLLKVKNVT